VEQNPRVYTYIHTLKQFRPTPERDKKGGTVAAGPVPVVGPNDADQMRVEGVDPLLGFLGRANRTRWTEVTAAGGVAEVLGYAVYCDWRDVLQDDFIVVTGFTGKVVVPRAPEALNLVLVVKEINTVGPTQGYATEFMHLRCHHLKDPRYAAPLVAMARVGAAAAGRVG
jgi:hypothetical protein